MPGIHPFKEVIIGDYIATKHGDKVFIKRKDGAYKIIELKDFSKFLQENVPNKTLNQDTFSKNCK